MSINLLPWRLVQHYQNLKKLCFRSLLCFLIGLTWLLIAINFQQAEYQVLANKKEQNQEVVQNLQQIYEQIILLQRNYTYQQEQQVILPTNVKRFLYWLSHLPLQQGELNGLIFSQQRLVLKGTAETQQEFEQLHQSIKQVDFFQQNKLTQFQPQGMQLNFEFLLSNEKNE